MNFEFYVALYFLTLHVISPVWLEKTDVIYSVNIVLGVFVFQPKRQILYLFNIGKYREKGKYAKYVWKCWKTDAFLQTPLFL